MKLRQIWHTLIVFRTIFDHFYLVVSLSFGLVFDFVCLFVCFIFVYLFVCLFVLIWVHTYEFLSKLCHNNSKFWYSNYIDNIPAVEKCPVSFSAVKCHTSHTCIKLSEYFTLVSTLYGKYTEIWNIFGLDHKPYLRLKKVFVCPYATDPKIWTPCALYFYHVIL